ncbi:acetate--CoA ligase family protein [Desulfoluna spongiiphila]|uniref:acetate--CoA ligase family protein n=1 Tax=Desulfoluna spongiiphila TaxID=419481 RepID=UPI0012535106|nr:acetate--CoA ligase [Desulfoluna spongiiphila]VVS95440.1 atp-grasp fold [Desulfoluna spongiiphila]
MEDLHRILNADSVAVIGASRDETKRGYQAVATLKKSGFEGGIYPVNPRERRVLGLRCYADVEEIKEPVDLALITTPAATVPGLLAQCGRKGIAGAVIIAGGFGEMGPQGKRLEDEILETARSHNVRLVGPNTSGIINMWTGLNLVGLSNVPKGDIALLTQSGNIALHLITEATLRSHKGFSYYVGVGNESDIHFDEYLEFFRHDEKTKAILIYVEGLRDGRTFLQQVYKTSRQKPIILLKSGRTSTGQKSAGSHTGALAGISEVARTSFERAGIINIEHPDQLFPVAETLSSLPHIRNKKVAILADGGGHATIASDLLTDLGLEIPTLSDRAQARLREILPHNAAVSNPVDVAGGSDANPEIFARCARIILNDANVGGLLIAGLFGGYAIRFAEKLRFLEEDAAHQMGKLVQKSGKPIVLQSLYNSVKPHSLELLRYYGIPVYESLDIATKCVGALSRYGQYISAYKYKTTFEFNWGAKAKKKAVRIIQNARTEGRRYLFEHEAKEVLRSHGAPAMREHLAKTADDAVRLAEEIGGAVVLKIVSPDILHKSDAGGVRLNLENEDQIRNAFHRIIDNAREYKSDAVIKGCLVASMKKKGVEVIIGTKIDRQFGPVVMFGIGGILVEVVRDVSFRVLPLSRTAASRMIDEIKSAPILNGFRGSPALDKQALSQLLLTVSEVIESYPDIEEMDLNPVIVHDQGIDIADARMILKKDPVDLTGKG